jgi:hypothetical protein
VPTLRLHIGDHTVYEGPAIAVPRVGDNIHHDGQILPIEAVVWNYADDAVSVAIVVGTRPYTF